MWLVVACGCTSCSKETNQANQAIWIPSHSGTSLCCYATFCCCSQSPHPPPPTPNPLKLLLENGREPLAQPESVTCGIVLRLIKTLGHCDEPKLNQKPSIWPKLKRKQTWIWKNGTCFELFSCYFIQALNSLGYVSVHLHFQRSFFLFVFLKAKNT